MLVVCVSSLLNSCHFAASSIVKLRRHRLLLALVQRRKFLCIGIGFPLEIDNFTAFVQTISQLYYLDNFTGNIA